MTDEELGKELENTWMKEPLGRSPWPVLARRARELLAAPHAPILWMTLAKILCKIHDEVDRENATSDAAIMSAAARVAYRLAQPVAAVDPDAKAKNAARPYYEALYFLGKRPAFDDWWLGQTPDCVAGWRAVAGSRCVHGGKHG